jgi:hypothetical protein
MGLHSTTKANEMLSQTEAIIAAAKVRYDKENFDRAKRNIPSN